MAYTTLRFDINYQVFVIILDQIKIQLSKRKKKKEKKELLRKVPPKIYEVILLWKKNKRKNWFVNISEYHL